MSAMMDLNLVRVFIAIFETQSVSAAANRLFITQPSASYALARLRDETGNELFKRSRKGMLPTPVASQLYAVFKKSLSGIEKAVADTRSFTPETSFHKFTLALSDLGELLLLPRLVKHLREIAPNVRLEVIPVEMRKLDEWLLTGKIDAALCSRNETISLAQRDRIMDERYVCLLNTAHPRIGNTLSLQRYLEEQHIIVSTISGHYMVEERIREYGFERKIALEVPHFAALGEVIAATELLVTLPTSAAKIYVARGNGRIIELPFELPNLEVYLYGHTEIGDITAKTWFYDLLKNVSPQLMVR
ncbi:LysR family transcriptional regulator [Erwinia aphidicola]|jgi:DNA-binding transcriptional LysR family regulator|uniref:LysR family transcriptional regulator n=1 Tax=Erwinia aphidicola TaxID=68334 RepID=A0ABU8DF47_ERWAP|nr:MULTISPECIES: LysR family transcriptional regulator [Erwinia]VTT27269.1 LysR family transcriptional regulator [Klebsiella pneumoniae]MBD1377726.1 LysR family transcriptional regulator [Erwinia aphidicola]MBN1084138.1 LysR family transcriptional regulator [Erwinia aphidicola]MCP2231069.1 DNA-binding transcriptional LysR family regulator [Erwinia aphidicola]MDI3439059.1 LysR family transcriptional regulator [Erwinia sp. V90_4]